jgi:Ankyrin repeats (3 copies)
MFKETNKMTEDNIRIYKRPSAKPLLPYTIFVTILGIIQGLIFFYNPSEPWYGPQKVMLYVDIYLALLSLSCLVSGIGLHLKIKSRFVFLFPIMTFSALTGVLIMLGIMDLVRQGISDQTMMNFALPMILVMPLFLFIIPIKWKRARQVCCGDDGPIHYLMECITKGKVQIVQELLEMGTNINAKINFQPIKTGSKIIGRVKKVTPLTWAVYKSKKDIVQLLLDNGADPNLATDYGQTPLEIAINFNQPAIAELLK